MTIPAKTREVFEYVKKCAGDMRTVSYEEVGDAVGLPAIGMSKPLGYIRDSICRERGLPWLNAIVVNKGTRRPGDAFLPAGVAMGRDEERLWRGMVLHVFGFDWEGVTFD